MTGVKTQKNRPLLARKGFKFDLWYFSMFLTEPNHNKCSLKGSFLELDSPSPKIRGKFSVLGSSSPKIRGTFFVLVSPSHKV